MTARMKQINASLPESGWNWEIFATTITFLNFTSSPPAPCFIKETSIQTQARWQSGTQRHLLCLLAFQTKSLFLPQQLVSQFINLFAALGIVARTW